MLLDEADHLGFVLTEVNRCRKHGAGIFIENDSVSPIAKITDISLQTTRAQGGRNVPGDALGCGPAGLRRTHQ
jgi:hypothetical protein